MLVCLLMPSVLFDGFRFQEQACLNGCDPSNLRRALEEAFLAENGFMETTQEIKRAGGSASCINSVSRRAHEVTGSNRYQESYSYSQVSQYLFLTLKFDDFCVWICVVADPRFSIRTSTNHNSEQYYNMSHFKEHLV